MKLKRNILTGVFVIGGLVAYIYFVSKWNRELIPPPNERSIASVEEAAKKEIELSFLENRDSILAGITYPALIYRYPQANCSSCVIEDL